MRSEDLLDTLIGAGVLESGTTDDALSVSETFHTLVGETKSSLERREATRDALSDRVDDPAVVDTLAAVGDDDLSFLAHYCVLDEQVGSLSHDDLVRTVAVLTQFEESPPRSEGAPDPFLPVHGDQLSTLLTLTRGAIVYVWSGECEPCDLMRETFEETFAESNRDLGLFAVHGPDWAELLYHEFDVTGAPATLYVLDREVDARLYGAHYSETVEGEIEALQALS